MKHTRTIFCFEKGATKYTVEYFYDAFEQLIAIVYENGNPLGSFSNPASFTHTRNPTKTQAKELLTQSLK